MEWLLAHADDVTPSAPSANTLTLSGKKENSEPHEGAVATTPSEETKAEAMETGTMNGYSCLAMLK